MVDAGANIGLFSLHGNPAARAASATIIAVEPSPTRSPRSSAMSGHASAACDGYARRVAAPARRLARVCRRRPANATGRPPRASEQRRPLADAAGATRRPAASRPPLCARAGHGLELIARHALRRVASLEGRRRGRVVDALVLRGVGAGAGPRCSRWPSRCTTSTAASTPASRRARASLLRARWSRRRRARRRATSMVVPPALDAVLRLRRAARTQAPRRFESGASRARSAATWQSSQSPA